jgi:hypothetical protein
VTVGAGFAPRQGPCTAPRFAAARRCRRRPSKTPLRRHPQTTERSFFQQPFIQFFLATACGSRRSCR